MFKKRVEVVLDMAVTTVSSLNKSFMSGGPASAEDAALSHNEMAEPKVPEVNKVLLAQNTAVGAMHEKESEEFDAEII